MKELNEKCFMITPDDGIARYNNFYMIFLAGPIKGALSWRDNFLQKFIESFQFESLNKPILFCNPQREIMITPDKFTSEEETKQIDWETHFLNACDMIIFNIPEKEEEVKDYARTTRFELGEQIGYHNCQPFMSSNEVAYMRSVKPVLICINSDFPGKNYILHRLNLLENPYINLYDNLEKMIKPIELDIILNQIG